MLFSDENFEVVLIVFVFNEVNSGVEFLLFYVLEVDVIEGVITVLEVFFVVDFGYDFELVIEILVLFVV